MAEIEDNGGKGGFRDRIPDCMHGGPHKFTKTHYIPSTQAIQWCRRCGKPRTIEFTINNGKITSTIIRDCDSSSDK